MGIGAGAGAGSDRKPNNSSYHNLHIPGGEDKNTNKPINKYHLDESAKSATDLPAAIPMHTKPIGATTTETTATNAGISGGHGGSCSGTSTPKCRVATIAFSERSAPKEPAMMMGTPVFDI
jgi:hypothetical protein